MLKGVLTMRHWVLGAMAVAALWGGALSAFQPSEATLRFQFQPRQVLTYEGQQKGEGTLTTNAAGQEVVVAMTLEGTSTDTVEVERVGDYGIATVLLTTRSDLQVTVSSPVQRTEKRSHTAKARLRIDPQGRILQWQTLDRAAPSGRAPSAGLPTIQLGEFPTLGFEGLMLPEKPIRAGDTWDAGGSFTLTINERPIKVERKGQGRFVGWEKVSDRLCAVLETTTETPRLGDILQQAVTAAAPTGSLAAEGEERSTARYWFDPEYGRLAQVRANAEVTTNFSVVAPTGQTVAAMMLMMMQSEKRLVKVGTAPSGEKQ